MATSEQLRNQVERATQRLAKLKARELLAEHRAKHQARVDARRDDAHRKIELGGLFVATSTQEFDRAELAGVLLSYGAARKQQGQVLTERMRTLGAEHLAKRELARQQERRRR